MRVPARAFLVVAVLFWLIAAPPAGVAGEGAGPPDHGNRGHGNGNGDHGNGGQGHGNGNRGHGNGNQGHATGNPAGGHGNQGGNGNGDGDHGGGDEGGNSGTAACDANALAAVRAMVADQCDCAAASNHGRYVSCVAHVANAAVRDGSLPSACHDAVMQCAARSACGKKGSVTCCRTDAQGSTRCSVKHGDAACKAPRGGTACVGTVPSCCDACGAGACPSPGSTTTTTPSVTSTSTMATTTTTTPSSPSGAFVDGLRW